MAAPASQSGFTLIELLAVVIILGMLAAVVTPRYFSLVDEARTAVAQGAVAEGVGRFYSAYGQYLIENKGRHPANLSALSGDSYLGLSGDNKVVAGDFRLTYSGGAAGADVSVSVEDQINGAWQPVPGVGKSVPWPGS
ncbi:MAG: prepilin-type N-terminal cleavage/methylation domain-containing protein [Desulfovibrionaceae bacterium]